MFRTAARLNEGLFPGRNIKDLISYLDVLLLINYMYITNR